ncbi:MAG: glycosyltransferase, partial [Candidatus Rokubacteria bacterium]|nr:glycosyltransferase [Candidatus Rokubacteria bacterium]
SEEERIVAGADRVVASNPEERARLVWYYRAHADRIRVIPCGVDLELFHPMDQQEAKAALGLGPSPLLLYVGRLRPIKGLETLLEAVPLVRAPRGVRPVLFVIGGDADEPENGHVAYLRERAAALGLDGTVRFLGAQPQERLGLYYAAAEMTVMPSYYESFGMVALEAMACGNPVIASRVGGLTSTVQDGVTGYLVPEGDPGILAERISVILMDETLRRQLGAAAVRWAAQFQWPCVAEAVCRLYAEFRPAASRHLSRARCR